MLRRDGDGRIVMAGMRRGVCESVVCRAMLGLVPEKISWRGVVRSVQPRIRLLRSFDQRSHAYLGYVLVLDGEAGGEVGAFAVGIGKAAQAKHEFQVGLEVRGLAVPVPDPRTEPSKVKWRFETHCYGPKSCRLYKAGPTRRVPGRGGMSWEEEDWVDEELTRHRGPDD